MADTVTDKFRYVADKLRSLRAPTVFGVEQVQMQIVTRSWFGGARGADGGYTESVVTIPNYYKIVEVDPEELPDTGGRFETEFVRVGPITPNFTVGSTSGGFTRAQLAPSGAKGVEIIYRLTGSLTGDFKREHIETYRGFQFNLVLSRSRTTTGQTGGSDTQISTLPNLFAWYRGDTQAPSIWSDLSGSGNHATQALAQNQPGSNQTGLLGQPCATFATATTIAFPNDFDNSNWTKFACSVVPNATTDPFGGTAADSIVESNANASHLLSYSPIGIQAGLSATYSIYAKAGARTWLGLTDNVSMSCYFNLVGAGTVGTQTACGGTITAVGGGWYLCALTFTISAGSAFRPFLATGDGVTSYAGNGVSNLYLYGADLNAGNAQFYNLPSLAGLTACEIFMVVQANTDLVGSGLHTLGTSGSATLYRAASGHIYDDFGSAARHLTTSGEPNVSTPHLYNVVTTSTEWTLSVDGTQIFTTPTNTVAFPAHPILGLSVGTAPVGTAPFNGQIADVMIFSAKNTNANRAIVKAYAAAHYPGLVVS